MGQETTQTSFSKKEEKEFYQQLKKETHLLKKWIQDKRFKNSPKICGYEAEGWLIHSDGTPYACSDKFIPKINHPRLTPELSKFNFEINGNIAPVDEELPNHLEKDLKFFSKTCTDFLKKIGGKILFIGTYPDTSIASLDLKQIYPRKRYQAINNRILELKKETDTKYIELKGRETLKLEVCNIMHIAETASTQIHLQVDFSEAKDFYNASLISSPIMSALCANAPYVCGKNMWEESRVLLFEKVIGLKITDQGQEISRAGLGHGFVKNCVSEIFEQNLLHPAILPEVQEPEIQEPEVQEPEIQEPEIQEPEIQEPDNTLKNLRLHNGTIWRWIRPVIGFDEKNLPHFRIEYRVPSSGPSLVDMQANILFFIGLTHLIKKNLKGQKPYITFKDLEKSFYGASKEGFSSTIKWMDGKSYKVADLISIICPLALKELNNLSLKGPRVDYLINDVIKNRTRQNGADWQKGFIKKFGKDFSKMIQVYWENQQKDIPVYQWTT